MTTPGRGYVGRFAPSPTGPLHAGSLVAALASWLDARAHGGRWLVRIEDVDAPRCVAGAGETILDQLAACGLRPDDAPVWQSNRGAFYEQALAQLQQRRWAYACGCTRKEIDAAWLARGVHWPRHAEHPYPGTCRSGLAGKPARAQRLLSTAAPAAGAAGAVIHWHDRRLGDARQDVNAEVGDFVLRRADGLWAYQLAVVVDDAAQGITHVVRGEDLADNTPRQIHLQRALSLPTPQYLHTPLVRGPNGEKLSKQNGALALDTRDPLAALRAAGAHLALAIHSNADTQAEWLHEAVAAWRARWCGAGTARGLASLRVDPFPEPTERQPMNTTPSGLQYEDTVPGTGATATAGQQVSVHYTGWLYNDGVKGAKFDSSKDRGDPFRFGLGGGQVIKGWDEGVQGMQVGGTRVLVIPAALGYGARGAGGAIPPNATLMFEVDLLGV